MNIIEGEKKGEDVHLSGMIFMASFSSYAASSGSHLELSISRSRFFLSRAIND